MRNFWPKKRGREPRSPQPLSKGLQPLEPLATDQGDSDQHHDGEDRIEGGLQRISRRRDRGVSRGSRKRAVGKNQRAERQQSDDVSLAELQASLNHFLNRIFHLFPFVMFVGVIAFDTQT